MASAAAVAFASVAMAVIAFVVLSHATEWRSCRYRHEAFSVVNAVAADDCGRMPYDDIYARYLAPFFSVVSDPAVIDAVMVMPSTGDIECIASTPSCSALSSCATLGGKVRSISKRDADSVFNAEHDCTWHTPSQSRNDDDYTNEILIMDGLYGLVKRCITLNASLSSDGPSTRFLDVSHSPHHDAAMSFFLSRPAFVAIGLERSLYSVRLPDAYYSWDKRTTRVTLTRVEEPTLLESGSEPPGADRVSAVGETHVTMFYLRPIRALEVMRRENVKTQAFYVSANTTLNVGTNLLQGDRLIVTQTPYMTLCGIARISSDGTEVHMGYTKLNADQAELVLRKPELSEIFARPRGFDDLLVPQLHDALLVELAI